MSGAFGPCECPLGFPHAVSCPNYIDLSACPGCGGEYGRHQDGCIARRQPAAVHVCVFPEEQEPGGRLILAPCLTCGFTALAALAQRDAELELARTTGDQMAREIVQSWKLLGLDEPDADDHLPTALKKALKAARARDGIYMVAMIPITAGAKRATGRVELEYEAKDAAAALAQAKGECPWADPSRNFAWRVVGRRPAERSGR